MAKGEVYKKMSSEWARKLANEKRQKIEGANLRQQKELSDRRLLHASSDKLWIQLFRAAEAKVTELVEEMGDPNCITFHHASDHNQFYLQIGPQKQYVQFSPENWELSTNGPISNDFKLAVLDGSFVGWIKANSGTASAYTSEEIAELLVERFFRSC